MILGIGNDLVEIARVRKILQKTTGKRFLERVLTPAEQRLAEERGGRLDEFVSGRFAAKEAVVKAFGCGIGKIMGFQDIEILPDVDGKPECHVSQQALTKLAIDAKLRVHVSITHTDTFAAAFAVIESV